MGLSHMQTLNDGMYHACYQDEQGSTAYITGDGGAVENCYAYDAFGNMLERKEGIKNDILYRGQKYDQETGQYYLRARYYNPVIGSFIQEDTYRGDGLNLYAYCGNNPVMYYDPSGHNQVSQPVVEPENPRTVNEGGALTGTVWDSINSTQPKIEGTEIPKSFEITVNGEKFCVHPNGTKHMGEYINRNAMSHGMPMNSQTILSSFQSAVGEAAAQGIIYEQMMKVGNWELIFSQPRGEGLLPVIKHAVYIP
ncbi:MAG: RHS repeat-associated core domain-containing protein [Lachnospiraceae bacterium]|nr:RHS repeat-associated core domain-containing protein [Lachnospiraceae bacterium]